MTVSPPISLADSAARGAAALTPMDLAELMSAFNDVTAKLEQSHEQLRQEVRRLTTELSEANAQVERSKRLAALGEMAAGIAHEVRNPLGSIRLYARMLEQDLSDRPTERAVAVKIAGAAIALDAVVSDVLTFSREFRVSRDVINGAEVLDSALEACLHDDLRGWRGVEVQRDPGAEKIEFEGDAGLVRQAMVNIIRNAFEAMATTRETAAETKCLPGQLLRLGARRQARGRGYDGPVVVLQVEDTGDGVSAEIAGRIFNPFFTTRATGTGLGLAIVNRIADAHGGSVVIRNNREREGQARDARGACVELILPVGRTRRITSDRRMDREGTECAAAA